MKLARQLILLSVLLSLLLSPAFAGAFIGQEAALTLALNDAGATLALASDLETDCEAQKQTHVYEVAFTYNGAEYDYDIDAISGEILSSHSEKADKTFPPIGDRTLVGMEAAITAALKDAGLSDASFSFAESDEQLRELRKESAAQVVVKGKIDTDDLGNALYEIDLITASVEYEYKIDAWTGAVVGYEIDRDD